MQRRLEESEPCGAHTREPTRATASREATSQSHRVLPYLSLRAAELRLQPGPQGRCRPHRPSGALPQVCAPRGWRQRSPVPFPSIRFTVKLKPNQQSCVFRLGSGQINWGLGWGWVGLRVGKMSGVGGSGMLG